jgi:SAM-dependent methyltransferase
MKTPELSSTRRFYEDLAAVREVRGLWGYDSRFNPNRIRAKPSVRKHFTDVVARYVGPSDVVLDLGCGPGGFLATAAPLCGEIVGVDVVPAFVDRCRETIETHGLHNAKAVWSSDGTIPFTQGTFDVVLMVDALHHCEAPQAVLAEVHRVLKPNGRFLVFEPNKLNPALALMCCLDRNEWGLLRLGSRRAYRRLLSGDFTIEASSYSGLLVGPEGRAALRIADFVSTGPAAALLGWLSPKIFIAAARAQRDAG